MNSYNKIPPQRGCMPQNAEDPAKGYPRAASLLHCARRGSGGGMSSAKLATPTSLMHRAREGGPETSSES